MHGEIFTDETDICNSWNLVKNAEGEVIKIGKWTGIQMISHKLKNGGSWVLFTRESFIFSTFVYV